MRKRLDFLSFLILIFIILPAQAGHTYALSCTEIDPDCNQTLEAHHVPGDMLDGDTSYYSKSCPDWSRGYMSVFSSMAEWEGHEAAPSHAAAPVPEPASMALVGCGIVCLGLFRRRDQRGH